MSGNVKTQDGIWSVPTLGLLRSLPCSELDDGTSCWVELEGDLFRLRKTDGRIDDGVNIVSPLAGAPSAGASGARWVRETSMPLAMAGIIGQALFVTSAGHVGFAALPAPPTIDVFAITPVKTSDYNAAYNDIVRCDTAAAPFAVILPSAVGNASRSVAIKKVSASLNAVVVTPSGGQTIDGAVTSSLGLAYQAATYVSDNANWMGFPGA